ncbi:uncharacterized protein BDR25DRAFT_360914 [Lindgomyces ingoldianus]|uniref:Uncharacterized protein n=1 Tax=Lindgomyces ingoldianus TaxID=673940 RepID=A0ACB6QDB3_9PLEO|nr:uncharacterized protein BDR25DRAFT_360914 [Lindgomyces ingoldianus]KAF2465014.1 hypothetical protein BDR25DRAFT_360914 [Lindgomyces ingoldianus]
MSKLQRLYQKSYSRRRRFSLEAIAFLVNFSILTPALRLVICLYNLFPSIAFRHYRAHPLTLYEPERISILPLRRRMARFLALEDASRGPLTTHYKPSPYQCTVVISLKLRISPGALNHFLPTCTVRPILSTDISLFSPLECRLVGETTRPLANMQISRKTEGPVQLTRQRQARLPITPQINRLAAPVKISREQHGKLHSNGLELTHLYPSLRFLSIVRLLKGLLLAFLATHFCAQGEVELSASTHSDTPPSGPVLATPAS